MLLKQQQDIHQIELLLVLSPFFIKKLSKDTKKTQIIGALVPLTQGGTFPGSSYIRVLLPYEYLNKHEFNFQVIDLKSVEKSEKLNCLVVQRNAISNPQDARQLVANCSHINCKLIYEIDDSPIRYW